MTHRGGVRLAGSFAFVLTLGCADGPSQVVATDICAWTADVQGGVSPFSYLWTNDGVTVSQQQYIGGQLPGDGDNSFDLEVRVTDSVGDYDTHTLRVTTNPMAPTCFF